MMTFKKPLILIGFKHVGKSVIGAALAKTLDCDHTDLDLVIQNNYRELTGKDLSCRQIAQQEGLAYFRSLESSALQNVMKYKPSILSIGGGTPLLPANQLLLKQGTVLWIKAPKGRIFERIKIHGRPAFFPEGEEAYEAFIRIWDEREPIYACLADYSIENLGTLNEAVESVINLLQKEVMHEA